MFTKDDEHSGNGPYRECVSLVHSCLGSIVDGISIGFTVDSIVVSGIGGPTLPRAAVILAIWRRGVIGYRMPTQCLHSSMFRVVDSRRSQ
jgi:hypothetical protein